MKELEKQFRPILENSPDGVYLWLDETHMICNHKMARMFGYEIREMRRRFPFLDSFVAEKDRGLFSRNYTESIAKLTRPVRFKFTAMRKDGSMFRAETDMIPISFKGHEIAYHFVREVRG